MQATLMSTRQPDDMVSSPGRGNPEVDVEMQASNLAASDFEDGRDKVRHWNEDPHFIATYLAHNTSKAAAVFRRYDKLAVYRLLLLSRELDRLEKTHDEFVRRGNPELAADLKERGFGNDVGLHLKEYYDLLRAYSQVLHLEAPADRTVKAIDRFVSDPESHQRKSWWGYRLKYRLQQTDVMQHWRPPRDDEMMTLPDLVSLYTPAENDYLSRFVDKFLYFFFLTPESRGNTKYVNEQKMQQFVTFVGTIISIGFLVSAMWVLWRLEKQMIAKLCAVTAFVVAFAGWLGFLTTAQRKDVIAATAAYAAVLVVFISQQS